MNRRLATLLSKIDPQESVILDCYNQAVVKDVAMTLTTRIDANNYYLLERIEMLPKEPFMYRVPYGKTRLGGIVPNHIAGTVSASAHEYNELVIEPIMQQNTDINPAPQMLKTQRTEQAKQLRKVNGDHGVKFTDSQEYTIKGDGVSKAVTTFAEKELLIAEPISCAMRGRNPDNPSDRTSGILTEQRLEMGDDIANCITTVQKDSLIAEPVALGYSRDSKPDKDGKFHTRRHFSDVANTVCASSSGTHEPLIAEPAIQPVGNIYPSGGQGGQVVNPDGIAPTVCECHGEVTRIVEEPIRVRQATKQGYIECPAGGCFDANYPDSKLRRGRVQENGTVSPTLTAQGEPPWLNEGRVRAYKEMPDGSIRGYNPNTTDKRGISEEQYASPEAIAPTVTTAHEPKVIEPMVSADPLGHAFEKPRPQTDVAPTLRAIDYKCPPVAYEPVQYYYRIRKLHPIETYRLMDVDDKDIEKVIGAVGERGKPALPKSAHYKLAGNSIVVSCMFHIFKALFCDETPSVYQTTLF